MKNRFLPSEYFKNIRKKALGVKTPIKIILPFVLLFSITVMIATPIAVNWVATRMEEAAEAHLSADLEAYLRILEEKETHLRVAAKTLAEKKLVTSSLMGEDKKTLLVELLPARSTFKLDILEIIGADSKIIANIVGPFPNGADLGHLELVRSGFIELNAANLIDTPQGVALAAVAPIWFSGQQRGLVLTGTYLNRNFLKEIKKNHQTEMVVFFGEKFLTTLDEKKTKLFEKEHPSEIRKITREVLEKEISHTEKVGETLYKDKFVPLKIRGETVAVLEGKLPVGEIAQAKKVVITEIILANAAVLLLMIVVGYAVGKVIEKPTKQIEQITRKIAEGDLNQKVEVEGTDEIGKLAISINLMKEKMQQYLEESHKNQQQLTLSRLGETFAVTHNQEKLLSTAVTIICDFLNAPAAMIMLFDPEKEELCLRAVRNLPLKQGLTRAKLGEGIAGWVAKYRKAYFSKEKYPEELPSPQPLEWEKRCQLSIPLESGDKLLGVLTAFCEKQRCFTRDNLETLKRLSRQLSVAIDNASLHRQVQQLAITDELTGVYNHRYCLERLETELNRASRFSHPLAILMIDIDFFKNYNDTCGHLQGDLILRGVAQTIKENLREIDIVARYGGEEFLVILPETDALGARFVAEKIRSVIETKSFGENETSLPIHLTVSIGAAVFPRHGLTSRELIKNADAAMYLAKELGRNKVIVKA